MTDKKTVIEDETLEKTSGGASKSDAVNFWLAKHAGKIISLYARAHPEMPGGQASKKAIECLSEANSCNSVKEVKTFIKNRLGMDVDDYK